MGYISIFQILLASVFTLGISSSSFAVDSDLQLCLQRLEELATKYEELQTAHTALVREVERLRSPSAPAPSEEVKREAKELVEKFGDKLDANVQLRGEEMREISRLLAKYIGPLTVAQRVDCFESAVRPFSAATAYASNLAWEGTASSISISLVIDMTKLGRIENFEGAWISPLALLLRHLAR